MPYNYSALLGKIVETFGTQSNFSKAIGLSEHSVSQKLNGKVEWKQSEIGRACKLMGIQIADIPKYFFAV
mgnify:CR=1 FL=1|jgi:DNA-binding XRE family transcriptional regulator